MERTRSKLSLCRTKTWSPFPRRHHVLSAYPVVLLTRLILLERTRQTSCEVFHAQALPRATQMVLLEGMRIFRHLLHSMRPWASGEARARCESRTRFQAPSPRRRRQHIRGRWRRTHLTVMSQKSWRLCQARFDSLRELEPRRLCFDLRTTDRGQRHRLVALLAALASRSRLQSPLQRRRLLRQSQKSSSTISPPLGAMSPLSSLFVW